MKKTYMQRQYEVKFVFRIVFFLVTFYLYLFHKEFLVEFMTHKFTFGISQYGVNFLHMMWAIFMAMMISHLIPRKVVTMALGKAEPRRYVEVKGYSEYELLQYVQKQNLASWRVMFVWLSFNAVFGVLYLFHIIDSADLLMLTVFYFLCDYICILVFCPFQTYIMKNKCCVNCRIYDWGHFMMFTPMLFIKNFFSWSLFFTSLIVLLHWEMGYAKRPFQYWEKSNQILQCAHCKDKTCHIKKKVAKRRH